MKKIKITRQFLKKLILPTIIFVMFLLIGVLSWYTYWTRQDLRQQSGDKIGTLVNRAVGSLNWPTAIDAQTGRVYIHEAKLTLPPAEQAQKLYYYYSPAFQDSQAELRLKDKLNVDMQTSKVAAASDPYAVFDAVPKLQACTRGYLVVFSPATGGETNGKIIFQKKLKDGRTAYVYLESACADNLENMLPYLKQMDSY
jgi:hypothetical protein